jgi:lysophospholipase L1-like esterase
MGAIWSLKRKEIATAGLPSSTVQSIFSGWHDGKNFTITPTVYSLLRGEQPMHIVRKFRYLVIVSGLALGFCGAQSADSDGLHSAIRPTPRNDKFWQNQHHRFLEIAKGGNVEVLFLGDSITQGWGGAGKEIWTERFAPFKAANFGIGGDRTEHVLWRLRDGKELHGISPKVVVLMIGTNNLGINNAEQVADGIEAIVQELRQQLPKGKILLLGIFPRAEQPSNPLRAKIKIVNGRIARLDDGKSVHYLDIGAKFLEPDGTLTKKIMPDFLHLSPAGYKIWADALQPLLGKMLGSK